MKHEKGVAMNRKQFIAYWAPIGALMAAAGSNAQASDSAAAKAAKRGPRVDYFPNVTLTTQEGKQVHFYDDLVEGKVFTLNLMYTTCKGACPGIMTNLVELQDLIADRLGREVFMYTLSLDPEKDTPEALKEYATKIGARAGWTFLTGALEDIEAIRRKLGFVDPDPDIDADRSSHSGMVMFGNERLDRWSACPALLKPTQLARSLNSVAGLPTEQTN